MGNISTRLIAPLLPLPISELTVLLSLANIRISSAQVAGHHKVEGL
jgi:hypothetical protein